MSRSKYPGSFRVTDYADIFIRQDGSKRWNVYHDLHKQGTPPQVISDRPFPSLKSLTEALPGMATATGAKLVEEGKPAPEPKADPELDRDSMYGILGGILINSLSDARAILGTVTMLALRGGTMKEYQAGVRKIAGHAARIGEGLSLVSKGKRLGEIPGAADDYAEKLLALSDAVRIQLDEIEEHDQHKNRNTGIIYLSHINSRKVLDEIDGTHNADKLMGNPIAPRDDDEGREGDTVTAEPDDAEPGRTDPAMAASSEDKPPF